MLLSEMNEDEELTATIEIFSRGNSRAGSWSTKKVVAAFKKHGYDIKGANPDKKANQLIQTITLKGNRAYIAKAREDINSILRVISTAKIPKKFTLIPSK